MYSVFGVAAMMGTFLVLLLQSKIGYHGMLLICLGMTIIAAIITFFYRFVGVNYTKLAKKSGYKI